MANVIPSGMMPEELEDLLLNIDATFRRKAIKAAVKEENKVILAAAKRNMKAEGLKGGKREGRKSLLASYAVKVWQHKNGAVTVGYVGARLKPSYWAYHAHLYELGHDMYVSRGSRRGTVRAGTAKKPLQGKSRVPGKGVLIKAELNTRQRRHRILINALMMWAEKLSWGKA